MTDNNYDIAISYTAYKYFLSTFLEAFSFNCEEPMGTCPVCLVLNPTLDRRLFILLHLLSRFRYYHAPPSLYSCTLTTAWYNRTNFRNSSNHRKIEGI